MDILYNNNRVFEYVFWGNGRSAIKNGNQYISLIGTAMYNPINSAAVKIYDELINTQNEKKFRQQIENLQ